jgi:hypothetical protein
MSTDYEDGVFINCPFDDGYKSLFNAIVFAIHDAGFVARCALEVSNAAQNRLGKLMRIISECKYGVHDISRTELDPATSLPRFNMPFELGIFLGCREYGGGQHNSKVCLILDTEPYRYQKFISDIAGQDIFAYGSREEVIDGVRGWLRTSSGRKNIPGGSKIYERYILFESELPRICSTLSVAVGELTFVDFTYVVTEWLAKHPLS